MQGSGRKFHIRKDLEKRMWEAGGRIRKDTLRDKIDVQSFSLLRKLQVVDCAQTAKCTAAKESNDMMVSNFIF